MSELRATCIAACRWKLPGSSPCPTPVLPNSSRSRPAQRTYLLGLVKNFSRSRRPGHQGHRENHQPRRQGRGVLDQVQVRSARPELEKAGEFVHFACTSEDINNTSHALQLKGARDAGAAAGAGRSVIAKLREMAHAQCRRAHAQPHPRPDRQPHHGGQGNRQRGGAPGRRSPRASIAAVKLLGKMNGAVGNYNAHLAAWPGLRLGGLQPARSSRRPSRWAWA